MNKPTGQILMEKLRNCPSAGDAMKEAMNDVFKILTNYEGEIEDLPYFSTLYTKYLLEEYTPKQINMYLKPLLKIHKKCLDSHLLHHVGEHILAELSSDINDLTKEELLMYYREMLNIGKTKNIVLNTIFPLTEMTLYKFVDHAFVDKAKSLQTILLQVIHLLLPRLSKNDATKFIPYNEALQVVLRKFSSAPFEEVVTFFLNCLNSKTDEVFLLETIYISILRHQYGKDKKDRTFVEFNCTKRKLTLRITPHDDIHRKEITMEIKADDIENVFIKEFIRIQAGEINVHLKKPLEIASLSHKMKQFSFRFNIILLRELTTFIGDSFIDRFFGGFKMYKAGPPTFTKPYSDVSKFPSISTGDFRATSDSTLNRTYLFNKEIILSTSQNKMIASLSSDNNVSYTTFHAHCTSTPERSDRRTIVDSVKSNEPIVDQTKEETMSSNIAIQTYPIKQERIKKMPAHLNNAISPVSFIPCCQFDESFDKDPMSIISSDLETLIIPNDIKPVVKDSNLNIWVSPPQLNTCHTLVLSPVVEPKLYVVSQSDAQPETFYSLESHDTIHAIVVDELEIHPRIYQKNNPITNPVEREDTNQFYSTNLESNESIVDDLITNEICRTDVFPEVIELENGFQAQSGVLNATVDKKRELIGDKIVSSAKRFKFNESLSVEFSDDSILQKPNLNESKEMMLDVTLQSDLQLKLSSITINDSDPNVSQKHLSASEIDEIGQTSETNTERHTLKTSLYEHIYETLITPKHCKLIACEQTKSLSSSSAQSFHRSISSKLRLKKLIIPGPSDCNHIYSGSVSCNKENIGVEIKESGSNISKPKETSKSVIMLLANKQESNTQLFSNNSEHRESQVLLPLEGRSMTFPEIKGMEEITECEVRQNKANVSASYTLNESPLLSSSRKEQPHDELEKFIDAEVLQLLPVISRTSKFRNKSTELFTQTLVEVSMNELTLPVVESSNTSSIESMDLEESVEGQIMITHSLPQSTVVEDCTIKESVIETVAEPKHLQLSIIQNNLLLKEFSSNFSQIAMSKENKDNNKGTNNYDNKYSEDVTSYLRSLKTRSSSESAHYIYHFANNQDDIMLSPNSNPNSTNEMLPLSPVIGGESSKVKGKIMVLKKQSATNLDYECMEVEGIEASLNATSHVSQVATDKQISKLEKLSASRSKPEDLQFAELIRKSNALKTNETNLEKSNLKISGNIRTFKEITEDQSKFSNYLGTRATYVAQTSQDTISLSPDCNKQSAMLLQINDSQVSITQSEKRENTRNEFESMGLNEMEQNFIASCDKIQLRASVSQTDNANNSSGDSIDSIPLAELIRRGTLKNEKLLLDDDLQTLQNIQTFDGVVKDLNEKESNKKCFETSATNNKNSNQVSISTTSFDSNKEPVILHGNNKSRLLIAKNEAKRNGNRNLQSSAQSWNRLVNNVIRNSIASVKPITPGEEEIEGVSVNLPITSTLGKTMFNAIEMEAEINALPFEEISSNGKTNLFFDQTLSQSDKNNFIKQSIVAVKSLDINKSTVAVLNSPRESTDLLDKNIEISSRFFNTSAISNISIERTVDNTLLPSTVENQTSINIGECAMEPNKNLGAIVVQDTLEEASTNIEVGEISEAGSHSRILTEKVKVFGPSPSYKNYTNQIINDNLRTATSFKGFDDIIASSTPRFTDQQREPQLSVSSIKERTIELRKKRKKPSVLQLKPIVSIAPIQRFSCYADCLVGLPPRKKRPPLPPIPPIEPVDIIDTLRNGQTAVRREATFQRLSRINYLVESYIRNRRFRIESKDDKSPETKSKRRNFKRNVTKNLTEISEQIGEI